MRYTGDASALYAVERLRLELLGSDHWGCEVCGTGGATDEVCGAKRGDVVAVAWLTIPATRRRRRACFDCIACGFERERWQ